MKPCIADADFSNQLASEFPVSFIDIEFVFMPFFLLAIVGIFSISAKIFDYLEKRGL